MIFRSRLDLAPPLASDRDLQPYPSRSPYQTVRQLESLAWSPPSLLNCRATRLPADSRASQGLRSQGPGWQGPAGRGPKPGTGNSTLCHTGTDMAATSCTTRGPMSDADMDDVAQDALVWCATHGLLVGDPKGQGQGSTPGVGLVHAPVTMLPTPFPASSFSQAYALAPLLNELVDAVSLDSGFLRSTLSSAAKSDSFTASLLDIHSQTAHLHKPKDIRLGLHRSDYMLDTANGDLLQVELNTIASSFPGLSSLVTSLHRYLVGRHPELGLAAAESAIPPNPASDRMASALAAAWMEYGEESAVVLMVVQPGERNLYDQHALANKVWSSHGVRVVRRTLRQVEAQARVEADRQLWLGKHHVAVVYYRAGYGPADYPSDAEWRARLLMEGSAAVSCPNIAYHLAGAKKVQQKLSEPGCLERFVPNESVAKQIRACFAGLWSLDSEAHSSQQGRDDAAQPKSAIEAAIEEPHMFVLKPQREGGGNNIYDEDVRTKLEELLQTESRAESLAAYILMQRILPPVHRTAMLRNGKWAWTDSLSELGVYSTYLRNGDRVVLNDSAGHLLRTKSAGSNEGGVATGYAVLDSPYLT